ncbi:MAG: GNAT family N-acetyltransferase [Anaerolineae bacterium]|jgi:GNAT superfamily N-acetyltransferase
MERGNGEQVRIRAAEPEDVKRVADLCGQLGYPASGDDVRRRLAWIHRQEEHAVYVAERTDGVLVGWVHVYIRHLLVADRHAELGGLVVDGSFRGRGVGRLLMEWAERWTRKKGCRAVYLRSNVIREGAHAFYEELGYINLKTQYAFQKILPGAPC